MATKKTKVTLHRALSELKLIDAKITKQTNELFPVGICQKGKLVDGHTPEKDFNASAKSKYDSIVDLITRKSTIKSAIVAANAKTKVKVANVTMTIADAINMKNSIVLKKMLIERLKSQYGLYMGALNKNNEAVNQNLQILLEKALGKDNVKTTTADVESISRPFLESNSFHLINPLKITTLIEKLEKEVSDFESDVDSVLSEANAVTTIEI